MEKRSQPASPPLVLESGGDQLPAGERLTGILERITYVNDENGYTVARLAARGVRVQPNGDGLVTVVGALPAVNVGESLELSGRWTSHPKHGRQFEVRGCRVVLPATVEGLRKYLGSGLIKGVGPVFAGRIVDTFGKDSLTVIDEEPERLHEVDGLGKRRVATITAGWQQQKAIKDVMVFLASQGVSTALAVRIYKQYGDASVGIVRDDPYRLAREVHGIGFLTADKIAKQVGIPPDAPQRAMAGLLHILWEANEDGHVYLTKEELLPRTAEALDQPVERLTFALEQLGQEEGIGGVKLEKLPEGWVGKGGPKGTVAVYPTPSYYAECGLASRLARLAQASKRREDMLADLAGLDFSRAFAWLESSQRIQLADKQQEAIQLALQNTVAVLTGGPGTGKTTTLRSLLTILKAKGKTVLLAAPTGRAAKRMADATGHPAQTLHRLLGIGFGGKTAYNADNPLVTDVIVVDEASMIDLALANTLVKAIAPGTHLLFVGDVDQLPSVGAGAVLRDILAAGTIPSVRLDVVFRQALESGIIRAAHAVNAGRIPQFSKTGGDCFFLEVEEAEQVAATIVELAKTRLPRRYGYNALRDIFVLCPGKMSKVGTSDLNVDLQAALNPQPGEESGAGDAPAGPLPLSITPPGPSLRVAESHSSYRTGAPAPSTPARKAERRVGSRLFRVGDRVLCLRNNYERAVFNGDGGWIQSIDPIEQEVALLLDDGREVIFDFTELDELTHAYAMTVHKSQGSEFPVVIMPITTSHYTMLQRTLLYTALTRAKKLVVLVGTRRALAIAVRTATPLERHSLLAWRLQQAK